MSDKPTSDESSKSPAEPVPASDTGKKPPRSRVRKWRRRISAVLLLIFILIIIIRASVGILLPPVLRKVASSYGLNAAYDRLDLYAMSGDVGLWNLRFTPLDGGEPILRTSYCRASISLWALLQGRLDVSRAEAESSELFIERSADGSLPLLQKALGSPAAATSAAAKPAKPLSFKSPFKIDVVRLQNARAHFVDHFMSPATDVSLQLNLLVSDVGFDDRKTRVELQLYSPEALAALYVNATAAIRDQQLDADLNVNLFGLNLTPAKAYLAPLGLVPVSKNLSAKANGTLHVQLNNSTATTQPSGATAATLAFDHVELTSNSEPAASIRSVKVDVPTLAPGEIRIASVAIDGVRVKASRSQTGALSFSGIELGTAEPAPTTQPTSTPTIELKNLSMTNIEFAFDDASLPNSPRVTATVPTLILQNLSNDPAQADVPAKLVLQAAAPGLARQIDVTGEILAGKPEKSLTLDIRAAGVSPTAAAPYLAGFGVKTNLKDGQFTARLAARAEAKPDGSLQAGLSVTDASFVDGDRTLVAMPKVDFRDVSVSPDLSRIRLGSADIEGPTLPLHRDASGELSALGFSYSAPKATAPTSSTSTTAPATQPAMPLALPAFEIGNLKWRGADITIEDLHGSQPLNVALRNLDVDVENLTLDSAAKSATPGTVRVSLKSPGLVDEFEMKGTVAPTGEAVAFDFNITSAGITIASLKPMLVPLGVEPVMKAGQLQLTASGSVRQQDGVLSADVAIRNASFTDGEDRWLALSSLQITNATFDGQIASVQSIAIAKPELLVTRDATGLLSAAGFKQVVPQPAAKAVVSAEEPPAGPMQVDLTMPIVARLNEFRLTDAKLDFRDAAVLPAADLSANVMISADKLAVGEDVAPSPYKLALSSPGVVDSLDIDGTLKAAPHAQSFTMDLKATGIDGRALEPYLPPNVASRFKNGSAAVKLTADVSPHADGGSKVALDVKDVELKDGVAADPVAAVKTLRVKADRLDLPGNRIAFDEITVAGAKLAVAQGPEGLSAVGMLIAPEPLRAAPVATAPAEAVATTQASDVAALTKQARVVPPLITIKKLSIGADRLSLKTPMVAQELAVTSVSLTNAAPIELLGEDPTQRPAFDLALKASVEQLVDSFGMQAHLAPFAAEPAAKIDVKASGIHAPALMGFIPALADLLDGQDLSDGTFTAGIDAQFGFARRGVMGIDLTRDVTANAEVRDLRLMQTGVDRPLAGVDGIRVERARYAPTTGALTIAAVEITKPSAHIVRDAAGIHALGLTLKMPAAEPTTAPTTQPEKSSAPPPASKPTSVASADAPAAVEQRIDSLTISGVDVLIEDKLGDVPTVLPINALDVEVKGLSTRALAEPNKPVRFSAIVGAGTQPLPGRGDKKGTTEDRPVFAEASASGNLTLVPNPKGYAKVSLSGLELSAIRGLASQAGINITSGTFDFRTDVRMSGAESFDARLYPTFNELRATEPANGPVQRILQLPAPLDVAISTLEDADGSITFPIVVPLEAGKLDTGAVIGSAVGAVARVMGEAMVAAPLKAAKLGAMLFGADTSSGRLKPIPPVSLDFAPGELELSAEKQQALQNVIERMRKDPTLEVTIQHVLSTSDVALVEQRANPEAPDSLALVERLRARRAELQKQQAADLSRVRVALASQSPAKARESVDAAQAVAVNLSGTEDALDQVLELLRPGAERQTIRRTKVASLLLANGRMQRVQQIILNSGLPTATDRVRKANALFNPNTTGDPGTITLTLTRRAKK